MVWALLFVQLGKHQKLKQVAICHPIIYDDGMTEHDDNSDDYYCARRDSAGNIRLNCGKGMLVANADHTIQDVQNWLARATEERWAAQYRAALTLLLDEAKEAVAASEPV